MPNKTISVPDDVVPIIEDLDVPFSRCITNQLRQHAAQTARPFTEQLRQDAELAHDAKSETLDAEAIGKRMGRTAPW